MVRGLGPVALLTCALPALAQPPEMARCAAIADPSARLACYDAMVARPATVPNAAEPPPAVATSPAVSPRTARAPRPREAPPSAIVDGRIQAIAPIGNDLFRIELSDGSVWRTGEQSAVRPSVGETVRIRRAMLAYYASIAGRAAIGVRPER